MIAEKLYVAPEEYLQIERAAELESEYINGEIIPMVDHFPAILAGASANRNLIKENVGF